jgi:aspartate/methionine/tyrosine aminotransferase
MQEDRSWLANLVDQYRECRDACSESLEIEHYLPEGGFYIFANVKEYLDDGGIWKFIDRLMDAGVSVSPGASSGKDYTDWIRICFVAAPPDRLREAMRRINAAIKDI